MSKAVRTLRKLHSLETMAVEIYRVQVPHLADPREREMMAAAMENEDRHRRTFAELLRKRGARSSLLGLFWWVAGQVLGRVTALLGRAFLLKGDVVFEEKAVREYSEFVRRGGFPEEEMDFLRRFLEDEKRHVANWKGLLGKSGIGRHPGRRP